MADETAIDINGKQFWLLDVMDVKTKVLAGFKVIPDTQSRRYTGSLTERARERVTNPYIIPFAISAAIFSSL